MQKRLFILLVLAGTFLSGSARPFLSAFLSGPAAVGKANTVHTPPAHQKPAIELVHLSAHGVAQPHRPLPKDPGGNSTAHHLALGTQHFAAPLPLAHATPFEKQYIDHIYPTHNFW